MTPTCPIACTVCVYTLYTTKLVYGQAANTHVTNKAEFVFVLSVAVEVRSATLRIFDANTLFDFI